MRVSALDRRPVRRTTNSRHETASTASRMPYSEAKSATTRVQSSTSSRRETFGSITASGTS
jgi:hypothetical protein